MDHTRLYYVLDTRKEESTTGTISIKILPDHFVNFKKGGNFKKKKRTIQSPVILEAEIQFNRTTTLNPCTT